MPAIPRIAFVAHFVICIAVAAIGFLAWQKGAIQWVYANDQTMITSVVMLLMAYGAVRLGWLAWNIGPDTASDDGHWIVRLCIYAAYTGTAIGLLLLAKSFEAAGKPSFGALAAALCTTATGGAAAFFLEIMTRSLEYGVARARRP